VGKSESFLRVLIADDYAVVRKGLIQILQVEFPSLQFSEAANATELYEKVRNRPWDLILLDFSMPGRNGLEILKQLKADGVTTPVLLLGAHTEEQYAIRSLKAGAAGFINKNSSAEEFVTAVIIVLKGGKYISSAQAEKLVDRAGPNYERPLHELLSDREMQILQFIANGKTVSEIADEISLSVNTISTYRTRILEKLRINNNAMLTRYALDNGLV
jgi:two-component system invasion response regulator UvrY